MAQVATLPSRRASEEERNALALQWGGLPRFVLRKWFGHIKPQTPEFEDMEQEGHIALLRAAELWDETRGIEFKTYACWVLCDQIKKARQRKSRSVAASMRLDPKNIDSDGRRMARECVEPEAPRKENDSTEFRDYHAHVKRRMLDVLTHRERDMVEMHCMGLSHRQISAIYGITHQRAQQLVAQSLQMVRERFRRKPA